MPPGPLSGTQARVIDPVLTTVAQGFPSQDLVFPSLLPVVTVAARGGKIIKFNAEDFAKVETVRAPGATRARASSGYGDEDYACVQRALNGVVPREIVEEAAAVPGINMQSLEVQKTMSIISLQIEREAATLATTAANYSASHHEALAGNAQWDHANSKPNKAVETACQKIRQGIGRKPNVLVLGPKVFGALRNHQDVLDQIVPTEGLREGAMPLVNEAKLAAYFDVERVVVGYAMTGEPGNFADVWGKNAVLAFSDITSLAAMGSPSFGYTYRLMGYPVAEPGWFNREIDSWEYPVTSEDTPVIVGKDAGFLFSTAVS